MENDLSIQQRVVVIVAVFSMVMLMVVIVICHTKSLYFAINDWILFDSVSKSSSSSSSVFLRID